jgi:hypothetical protein
MSLSGFARSQVSWRFVMENSLDQTWRSIEMPLLRCALILLCLLGGYCAVPVVQAQSRRSTERRTLNFNIGTQSAREAIRMRQAGIHHDRTLILKLLETLQKSQHAMDVFIAMRALCALGAEEALPEMDRIITEYTDYDNDVVRYTQVCRARLVAEAGVRSLAKGELRASEKLRLFGDALHLDSEQINTIVAKEKEKRILRMHVVAGMEVSQETIALREIADMIYRARDEALLTLARKQGLKFDLDTFAGVKVKLALLPQKERIAWLISELANKKVMRAEDDPLIQLAADEGKAAGKAAAVKLQEISENREKYVVKGRYYPGFAALMRLVGVVGDKAQEPFVAKFRQDKDAVFVHEANIAAAYMATGSLYAYTY